MKNRLKLNPRQFGFRNGTSTTMAGLILKETIKSYTHKNSKVYPFFLNLSKAFDKVNHFILTNKLCSSKVSPVIVNILSELYSKQYVDLSFNSCKGDSWLLKNGVHLGCIISPLLFNFYIDDIKCN